MTAFKGKNVSDYWMAPAVENLRIIYAATKYGWMEAETFSNYITGNCIINIHPEMPAVLIYVGLSYYIDVALVDNAREKNTVIFKSPTHTSHVL
jgi:hypothetical protein